MSKPPARKTTPGAAGYSGKPLIDKLGFKAGSSGVVVGAPANYAELTDGAAIKPLASFPKAGSFDFLHVFVKDEAALASVAPKLDARLAPGGMIWLSWPKKSSAMFRDLTEDAIRRIILPAGRLVDVKVCAVDADWSGLKLMRRKA